MQSNATNIKNSTKTKVKIEATSNQDVAGGSNVSRARPALATITDRVANAPANVLGRRRRSMTIAVANELVDKPKPIPKKRITTKDMIIEAITALNDEAGSTVASIKAHVLKNHEVDEVRSKFMERVLRTAHQEGWLIRTSGTGSCADSRFKLPDGTKMKAEKSFEPTPGSSNESRGVAVTNASKGSILVREDSGENTYENKKKKKVSWNQCEQVLHFHPASDSHEDE